MFKNISKADTMNTVQFRLVDFFKTENTNILDGMKQFDSDQSFANQSECVREFSKLLLSDIKTEDKDFIQNIFTFLFLTLASNNPLKKTIARCLGQIEDESLLQELISNAIYKLLDYIKNLRSRNLEFLKLALLQDSLVCSLMSSFDSCNVNKSMNSVVGVVTNFVSNIFFEVVDGLWGRNPKAKKEKSESLLPFIHNSSKFLLTLLQKYRDEVTNSEPVLKIINYCVDVIKYKTILYETKSNCGYMIIILCNYLPEDLINDCTFKDCPPLEFLKLGKEHSPFLEKLGMKTIENGEVFETFKLSIFVPILSYIRRNTLHESKIYGKVIALYILEELILADKSTDKNNSTSIGIAKGISLVSGDLYDLPYEDICPFLEKILCFILMHLDDRIEVVRNHTKLTYRNIIKWAEKFEEEGNEELLELLVQWVLQLPECTAYYVGISLVCEAKSCEYLLERIPDLAKQILYKMDNLSKVNTICPCYEFLMKKSLKEMPGADDWVNYWVKEIIEFLKASQPPLTYHFQNLFESAFTLQPIAFKALTQQTYINTPGELGAFLRCIRYARRNTVSKPIKTLYPKLKDGNELWRDLVEAETLNILSTSQLDDVRLLVLDILVESKKTTEIFTKWELESLVKFIHYNINTFNSNVRYQVISYIKRVMSKIKDGTVAFKKLENRTESDEMNSDLYALFWVALFRICSDGLNVGCNYGRRTTCLDILKTATDILKVDGVVMHINNRDLDNLKYIVEYDTYEHNKKIAVGLLNRFPAEKLGFTSVEVVQRHIEDCLMFMLSRKPARTISAAYMLKICLGSEFAQTAALQIFKLCPQYYYKPSYEDNTLFCLICVIINHLHRCYLKSQSSMEEAVAFYPLHGLLLCLRHLLEERRMEDITTAAAKWRQLHRDILQICFKVGSVVESIICTASPEGYIPDDIEHNTDVDETSKAQMVTVYGWRAAKEVSLLLGEIALNVPHFSDRNKDGFLNDEQFQQIGRFFYNLLMNTKHRGAFEQASIGFYNVCYRLHRVDSMTLNELPRRWLRNIFNNLFVEGNTSTACATRRSAGIPFMIQAILASEPTVNGSNSLLHQCFDYLLSKTKKETVEQQIHSMNILRALFRHNQLSSSVTKYSGRAMIIAINGFGNKVWGIRNSATLLFSALMNKIFGVLRTKNSEELNIKNKMMVEVFFTQYPELYDFLLKELKENTESGNHHPGLFPILLVLSRLYYNGQSIKSSYDLKEYTANVWLCLSNPSAKIRELAGKIYINLIHPNEIPVQLINCFALLTNSLFVNSSLHGILMMTQHLLQNHKTVRPKLDFMSILDKTGWISVASYTYTSYVNAALYMEIILTLLLEMDPDFDNCEFFTKLLAILRWFENNPLHGELNASPAIQRYRMLMLTLKLYLFVHSAKCVYWKQSHGSVICIGRDLSAHNELLDLSVCYVNYIYFTTVTSEYSHHNLFEDDDWECAEMINKFMKPLKKPFKMLLEHVLYKAVKNALGVGVRNVLQIYAELYSLRFFLAPESECYRLAILANLSTSQHEQTITLCIAGLDVFLKTCTDKQLEIINFDIVLDIILKYSSPLFDDAFRLGIAKLLVNNKRLFWKIKNRSSKTDTFILPNFNLCTLWQIVFVLLEDDDEDVRNTMCQLCHDDSTKDPEYLYVPEKRLDIPEYSRRKILDAMVESLEEQCCINLLLSLMLRGQNLTDKSISEVFDEGDLNIYAETYPLARDAGRVLNKVLWDFEDDASITIEQHAFMIGAHLQGKFIQDQTPFISEKMCAAVSFVLNYLVEYVQSQLGNAQPHFKRQFRAVCDSMLEIALVRSLSMSELLRFKMFIEVVFRQILWDEEQKVDFNFYPQL